MIVGTKTPHGRSPFGPLAEFIEELRRLRDDRKDAGECADYFLPMLHISTTSQREDREVKSAFTSPFELVARFRRLMQQLLYNIAISKNEDDKRIYLQIHLAETNVSASIGDILLRNQCCIIDRTKDGQSVQSEELSPRIESQPRPSLRKGVAPKGKVEDDIDRLAFPLDAARYTFAQVNPVGPGTNISKNFQEKLKIYI